MTDVGDFVLIVEDDPETARALAEFLHLQGHACMIAENGQEAMDLLRAGRRPCLILLDIMMPVKSGWDVRNEMVADPGLAAIPIVVVTADVAAIARATALSLPLLTKPIDPAHLMSEVTRHC